jgi:FkbM family methyltransferase
VEESMIDRFVKKEIPMKVVYDIGANNGNWSKSNKRGALLNAEFILFEANKNHYNSLCNTGFKFFNTVLSSPERKTVTFFHRNGSGTGDSYYKEKTTLYQNDKGETYDCRTLDSIIEENNLPLPDFIKIDTQGSELDIFSGGKKAVQNAGFILTECPIIEYNEGAPNIHDYLSYMKNNNFVPIHLMENHVMNGILVQIDILFMKRELKEKHLGATTFVKI